MVPEDLVLCGHLRIYVSLCINIPKKISYVSMNALNMVMYETNRLQCVFCVS